VLVADDELEQGRALVWKRGGDGVGGDGTRAFGLQRLHLGPAPRAQRPFLEQRGPQLPSASAVRPPQGGSGATPRPQHTPPARTAGVLIALADRLPFRRGGLEGEQP